MRMRRNEPTLVVLDSLQKATKTENGLSFPSRAFAFVPDPQKPSTWKLRLWETPSKGVTRAQVGRAIAAIGKGFRGNRVQGIPASAMPRVKAKIRAAFNAVKREGEELPEILRG